MNSNRVRLLCSVAGLVVAVLIWQWIAGWGLITANLREQPLSKAIKTIEWQGGVKIVTNADLKAPITLQVKRVPVAEALETVAAQLDAEARVAYIAAPTQDQIKDVLSAFAANTNPGDWEVFSPGFGGGGMSISDVAADPRQVVWNVSDMTDRSLQAIYGQGSQKTGALFATPKAWNPVLGKMPGSGKTKAVATRVAKAGKGRVEEVFLLTVRPPRGPEGGAPERGGPDRGGPGGMPATVFSPRFQRGAPGTNPEWVAERMQAEIAKLPADQRGEAQKLFDEFRALAALPEEERREKMREYMEKPEVQAAMEERMSARDARRTPEQRAARYKRYIDRKTQISGKSPQAPQT